MESIPKPDQILNGRVYAFTDLIAAIVALTGSIVIFLFFININIDPIILNKIYITIKPGYASWAWGIFSISSMLYYFVSSKGITTTGGYINPLFSGLLKVIQIIPFIALVFSWVDGTKFIIENQTWDTIINASSNFLNSILVLFLVANFSVGVAGVKRFIVFTQDSPV
jgi:hypothetical protein